MSGFTLNMIVKNEEKVIERCLSSVLPIVDFFVILDTGSTDRTVEIIQEFFSKTSVKGVIQKGEFKNFSHARNMALNLAYNVSKTDYILFIDADMVLQIGEEFSLTPGKGSYYITQGDGKLEYKNTRIVRNNRNHYYKGYTHEVILPVRYSEGTGYIPKDQLYIIDHGDGGSKNDKLERDIGLLLEEINEKPEYSRPHFYLANTYFGKREFENAEKYYRKRIELGGWMEELWYSYYKLGMIKIVQNDIPQALWFLFSSIETHPRRLESYFHLIRLLTDSRMDLLCEMFREKASRIMTSNFDKTDYLFYEKHICEIELPKLLSSFK